MVGFDLRGLTPAPVTPFTPDGAVEYQAIQRLGSWLGSIKDVKGLVVLGHAGEGTFLTAEEQTAVIQAFAQKQALDQTQAHAAIQAHLAPTSLLAKESQVYNNGEGPLTQALSARDNAVSALNYAAQSQTTPPHVISDLSARAQHADQVAKQGKLLN